MAGERPPLSAVPPPTPSPSKSREFHVLEIEVAVLRDQIQRLQPAKSHWAPLVTASIAILSLIGAVTHFVYNALAEKPSAAAVVAVGERVDDANARIRTLETTQAKTQQALEGMREDMSEIKGALLYPRRK